MNDRNTYIVATGLIIFWAIILTLIVIGPSNIRISDYVVSTCLEHGYPEYIIHGDKAYCIKTVDGGGQVVINVDDLEPK